MEDKIAKLEVEYCPPVDPALLRAILSDFDLGDDAAIGLAREILDPIKASAAAEEAIVGFSSADAAEVSPVSSYDEYQSETADSESTNLSIGLSRLSIEGKPVSGTTSPLDAPELDSLDAGTKSILLQELFPTINEYTIKHTLAKCGSEWQRALDELLNISFLTDGAISADERISNKSIDAFAAETSGKRGRRKKRKGINAREVFEDQRAQSASSVTPGTTPLVNAWRNASSEIEFIAKHANLSSTLVSSAYYANNASVSRTITYLLDDLLNSTAKTSMDNRVYDGYAKDLGRDFPSISSAYLTALVQLTHPSSVSAHALAQALVSKPPSMSSGHIVPQYSPITLSDSEQVDDPGTGGPQFSITDRNKASSLASVHHEARRRLSAQAQAAYRRSKSQRLMGGAAAYYSSVSRDHAAHAAAYGSAAADALVASQSGNGQLDLHGVIVSDAVRIARRETNRWWNGLGESKVNGRVGADTRQKGFSIVVGIGRHSEGGKSKIGPAVYSALANEGWKVEKGQGVLTVQGRSR
ncbi:hypothetical protein ANO11243_064480 [Dothideomycetidae sp. 11243]|nr:hypothetical protein ANO11243_064480 [fungal sp. No.11243]